MVRTYRCPYNKILLIAIIISTMFERLAIEYRLTNEVLGTIGILIRLILCYVLNYGICVQVEDLDDEILAVRSENQELSMLY